MFLHLKVYWTNPRLLISLTNIFKVHCSFFLRIEDIKLSSENTSDINDYRYIYIDPHLHPYLVKSLMEQFANIIKKINIFSSCRSRRDISQSSTVSSTAGFQWKSSWLCDGRYQCFGKVGTYSCASCDWQLAYSLLLHSCRDTFPEQADLFWQTGLFWLSGGHLAMPWHAAVQLWWLLL